MDEPEDFNSDLADRLMAMAVDIAKAEISARFHNGSFEEIEAIGRQKQRMVQMLQVLIASGQRLCRFVEKSNCAPRAAWKE